VLRILVENAAGLVAVTGSGNERKEVVVRTGAVVNLATGLAALQRLQELPVGTAFRVDYLGWGETKDGVGYRKFKVGVEKKATSGGPGLEHDVPLEFPAETEQRAEATQ
jgi:hypothetical protein